MKVTGYYKVWVQVRVEVDDKYQALLEDDFCDFHPREADKMLNELSKTIAKAGNFENETYEILRLEETGTGMTIVER